VDGEGVRTPGARAAPGQSPPALTAVTLRRIARSVTEILPSRFAELTLEDVAQIVARIGEERENLYVERKAQVNGNALAKACSAFANTFGGLLIVGVADKDDELIGTDAPAKEAQLWVKDTLRGLVLPMPPFRARWLDTKDGRGLLLVLVEESSTTPHLLTRSGAIYVRNPGSSDPVPIGDQGRLLDLTRRGREAIEGAKQNARHALNHRRVEKQGTLMYPALNETDALVVAASGVSAEFERKLFEPGTPDTISATTWGEREGDGSGDVRYPLWTQDEAGVHRVRVARSSHRYRSLEEAVLVGRNGAVSLSFGYEGRTDDPRDLGSVQDGDLRSRFRRGLAAARKLLTELGAHGDLRLIYRLTPGARGVTFDSVANVAPFVFNQAVIVELDTSFDDDDAEERVFAEVLRATGVGPRAAT
jgi:hypothetical protein